MVLREVFGPKRGDMTRGWRKLHNKELIIYNFYQIVLFTYLLTYSMVQSPS